MAITGNKKQNILNGPSESTYTFRFGWRDPLYLFSNAVGWRIRWEIAGAGVVSGAGIPGLVNQSGRVACQSFFL